MAARNRNTSLQAFSTRYPAGRTLPSKLQAAGTSNPACLPPEEILVQIVWIQQYLLFEMAQHPTRSTHRALSTQPTH
jgi:hypothetical protein